MLTIQHEIQYIWSAGFSGVAVLFYLLRYCALLIIVTTGLKVCPWPAQTIESCEIIIKVEMALNMILLSCAACKYDSGSLK